MNVMPLVKLGFNLIKANAGKILSVSAVAFSGAATISAVKATPKAMEEIKAMGPHQEKKAVVKKVWKHYLPAVGYTAASALCVVGINHVAATRAATLLALANSYETALSDYKDSVGKFLDTEFKGEKEEALEKISKGVNETHHEPADNSVVITNGSDKMKCLDTFTGIYFESSRNAIDEAINFANKMILDNGYISLNEFYDLLGLPMSTIGDLVGFKAESLIDVAYSAVLDENMQPILAFTYSSAPTTSYDSLY